MLVIAVVFPFQLVNPSSLSVVVIKEIFANESAKVTAATVDNCSPLDLSFIPYYYSSLTVFKHTLYAHLTVYASWQLLYLVKPLYVSSTPHVHGTNLI